MPVDIGRIISHLAQGDQAPELSGFFIFLEHALESGVIRSDIRLKLVCRFHLDRSEGTDHEAEGTLMAIVTLVAPVSVYLGIL